MLLPEFPVDQLGERALSPHLQAESSRESSPIGQLLEMIVVRSSGVAFGEPEPNQRALSS